MKSQNRNPGGAHAGAQPAPGRTGYSPGGRKGV